MSQPSERITLAEMVREGVEAFRGRAENPAGRARYLISAITGIGHDTILAHPETSLCQDHVTRCRDAIKRHANGEPISRITGEREFWGLPFQLSADTLDPRPDTETLVEAVLKLLPKRDAPLSIVDLGTGTGAVGVALLTEYPNATCLGVDRAECAALTSRKNAESIGVGGRYQVFTGSWLDSVSGTFDVIVSNPPYIKAIDLDGLDTEVRDHDPALALDGGEDGLDAYRSILKDAGRCLKPGGYLLLEIGVEMGAMVRQLALEPLATRADLSFADLSGRERVVGFQKKHLE